MVPADHSFSWQQVQLDQYPARQGLSPWETPPPGQALIKWTSRFLRGGAAAGFCWYLEAKLEFFFNP